MSYRPELDTAPDADDPVVTLAELKAWCRVEGSDEDALLESLGAAAVQHLDGYSGVLGRALVTQTWLAYFDALAKVLRLPLPATEIGSISVRALDGTPSTIDAANYALQDDARGSRIRFVDAYSWPTDVYETRAVTVTFTAGFGDAADVPADIKTAIKMLVAHWYAHREAVGQGGFEELPLGVRALLAPYRRVGV